MKRLLQFLRRYEVVCVPIFLAIAYFLIQFLFIDQYGVSWDEPLHRNWGKLFALFLRTGDRAILPLMPGNGVYYGPLFYLVNFRLSEFLYKGGFLPFVASNHVLTLATAAIICGGTYALGRMVKNSRTGWLAVILLIGFPQFLAHSHYNPKDIPLAAAVLLCMLVFIHGLKTGHRSYILLAGAFFGAALAMKVSALLVLPALGISYLFFVFDKAKAQSQSFFTYGTHALLTMLFTVLVIAVSMYALWPTAWGDPLLIARSFSFFVFSNFWSGQVLFFGSYYSGAALPWYYIPFELLMAMPVLSIAVFMIGCAVLIFHIVRKKDIPVAVLLLLWLFVPLLASVKPGLVRYDGFRQFFFCLPAIVTIGAIGFDVLLTHIATRWPQLKWLPASIVAIFIISFAYEIALVHPYEGSYRNEILRFAYPQNMDRQFNVEYWGSTYKEGIEWMNENASQNPVICVPTAGVLVTWYPWRPDFTFECSAKSNYIMFFTRYEKDKQRQLDGLQPVFTIRRYNADLLKIYRIQ
jgi:4-amino-4-deoxy-L-arabinose transferase-like glycosyltransferase